MPSWIGPWEIGIVVVLVLLIFGPRKLPELGQSLGNSIRGFKKGMKEGPQEAEQAVSGVREVHEAKDAESASLGASAAEPDSAKTDKSE